MNHDCSSSPELTTIQQVTQFLLLDIKSPSLSSIKHIWGMDPHYDCGHPVLNTYDSTKEGKLHELDLAMELSEIYVYVPQS
jgi:hypothetical protein